MGKFNIKSFYYRESKDVEQKLSGNGFELEKVTPFGEECVNFGINQGETLFILRKIK